MKKFRVFIVLFLGFFLPVFSLSAAEIPKNQKALHVLNRLAYGPTADSLAHVESIGTEAYLQEQLSPESLREPDDLTQKLSRLQTLKMNPIDLFKRYGPPLGRAKKQNPELVKAARQKARIIVNEAVQARLLRAVESPRQLQEVMTDFWFNHFNVFAEKGLDHLWVGSYETQAIRPYALGRFRDLLEATAKHPAMSFYLDNWQNTAPNLKLLRKKMQGLNENYAREVMELHTLGADGGYTQQDVIALAKIFTGWGFTKPGQKRNGEAFAFEGRRHDYTDKIFLGYLIRGQGQAEGEQALDLLARNPATAHHISYELAQYFVSDKPPAALVDRLAGRFLQTDGNIREVLNLLFHSPEFWDSENYGAKFKTPYQYLISVLRASGKAPDNFRMLSGILRQWGMPMYGCLTPDGYKNVQEAWLNSDSLLKRISLVTAFSRGNLKVSSVNSGPLAADTLSLALKDLFSKNTQEVIQTAPRQLKSAAMLGSPEFMRR